MELNLARDVKNKKGFYRYIDQKRQAKESVLTLINEKGELATTDMESAEVLNKLFASIFTGSQASHVSHIPEPLGDGWRKKILPTVAEEHQSTIQPEPMLIAIIITSSQRKMQAAIALRAS